MGWVAQALELVLILRSSGILAGNEIFDRDGSIEPANPRHFLQDASWLREMMEGKSTDHDVELALGERKLLGIALLEAHVSQAALLPKLLRFREQSRRKVDPDNLRT